MDRRHHLPGRRCKRIDAQRSGRSLLKRLGRKHGVVDVGHGRPHPLDERLSCIGERDAPRCAVEQSDAQTLLKLCHGIAQGRCGHSEFLCRGSKGGFARNCDDRFQILKARLEHYPVSRNSTSIFIPIIGTSEVTYLWGKQQSKRRCPMQLPETIQSYFAADRKNNCEALLECFAPDATVHDEGRTHSGRYAIGSWWEHSKAKYRHTAEPFEAVTDQHGAKIALASLAISREAPRC